MSNRTLKEDRELAEKLATKLGHELGGWGWWFCLPKRISFCKLCGKWVGITEERQWKYPPVIWGGHDSGIVGTAITDDYELSKTKCSGVGYRARERSRWMKRFKRALTAIKGKSQREIAMFICGEKP